MVSSESTQIAQLVNDYSSEQLAIMYLQERKKCKSLQVKMKEIQQKSKILVSTELTQSTQIEAEEEFIANKLMQRLREVQEEKERLKKRLLQEEDNITYNLKKRLKELTEEKVEMENQLEQEQEYMTNRLSKQLKEAIQRKEQAQVINSILQKKLEAEKKIKEDLASKIEHEENIVKQALLGKLEQLQKEKIIMENELEAEGEYLLNSIRLTLDRIVSEKKQGCAMICSNLEHHLAMEVKEKQDIVLALEKEKNNLTKALQRKIKEIKRDKKIIKSHIKASGHHYDLGSNSSTPRAESTLHQYATHLHHVQMMTPNNNQSENEASESERSARQSQRSKKLHRSFHGPHISTPGSSQPASARKMKHEEDIIGPTCFSNTASVGPTTPKGTEDQRPSVGNLSTPTDVVNGGENLEKFFDDSERRLEVLQRDKEYYERRNSAMMRKIMALTLQLNTQKEEARKYSQVIEQLRINNPEGFISAHRLFESGATKKQMTNLDLSVDSFTDSSVISMDSSFSLQSDDKSMSIDLRGSIESNQDTQLAHAIRSQSNPRAN